MEAGLSAGATLALEGAQAHYATTVMRVRVGESLALFNGRDGEWRAEVRRAERRTMRLEVCERLRPQAPEDGPWLVFAPVKGPRLDVLVEKAVELGVSVLQPVLTRRTIVRKLNGERLCARVREAAEQCERLTVPEVRALRPLEAVLAAWPPTRRLLYAAERGAGAPLAEAAAAPGPAPAVLVGPEGGFETSELDALGDLSFAVPVILGPRILRAETAALAALAVLQALGPDAALRPAFRS